MKVKFIKEHELGSNTFVVGKSYEVVNSLAEQWIEEGVCEVDNSVPLPQEEESTEEESTEEVETEVEESTEEEPEPDKPQRRRRRPRLDRCGFWQKKNHQGPALQRPGMAQRCRGYAAVVVRGTGLRIARTEQRDPGSYCTGIPGLG